MNRPVTREALQHVEALWGPSVALLKGKMTRDKSVPVSIDESTIPLVPPHILEHHQVITLGMDIMKLNKICKDLSIVPFLRFPLQ